MHKAGYLQGRNDDDGRPNWDGDGPRPLVWSAWYPAADGSMERERLVGPPDGPLFSMGAVAEGAPLSEASSRWPVVLVSHGTGGSADVMGWLGRRLAKAGFVAISVNHHGNTGIEPYRAEGFVCWWERAADLTVLLDQLAIEGPFAGRLDQARVYAAGFSLGGYTTMALAGAITDMALFQDWWQRQENPRGPREFPDVGDHVPKLMETSKVFRTSWDRQSRSYADQRVRAIFAMAPAPAVYGFTAESLAKVRIPVEIMVGANDQEAPPHCSEWLDNQLSENKLTILSNPIGHFVFLCEATERGRSVMPDICVDAPGVDRGRIHDQAAEAAINLFRKVPAGAPVRTRLTTATSQSP
ncbi:MAG: dienelactone hydrolase family protein [Pseudomonadota bacterium]